MSKAAELLYIAQPSLSSAVKELENELGVTIFSRSGRGVSLTADGEEFLTYAGQIYQQYEALKEKYTGASRRKKFGVSAQHYSFAVKAFVDTVRHFDTCGYDFAIRETKTEEVINDVYTLRSEIGVLYLSDFNRSVMTRIFDAKQLSFTRLINCGVFIYLWREHPLAAKERISLNELEDYPCLTFEQGDKSSFYYAEEIFPTGDYKRVIHALDRSTMLNLMKGLNGYTFCSGVICALNGTDFSAVPLDDDSVMEIGYITRRNILLSEAGEVYLRALREYLVNGV